MNMRQTLFFVSGLMACATGNSGMSPGTLSTDGTEITGEEIKLMMPAEKAPPRLVGIRTYNSNPRRQELVTPGGRILEWAPGGKFCGLGKDGHKLSYKCFMIGLATTKNGRVYGVAKRQLLYFDTSLDNFVLDDASERYEYTKANGAYIATADDGSRFVLDFSGNDPTMIPLSPVLLAPQTKPAQVEPTQVEPVNKPPEKVSPAKGKKKGKPQKRRSNDDDLPPRTRRILAVK